MSNGIERIVHPAGCHLRYIKLVTHGDIVGVRRKPLFKLGDRSVCWKLRHFRSRSMLPDQYPRLSKFFPPGMMTGEASPRKIRPFRMHSDLTQEPVERI